MKLIGICGKKRSGKDTAGDILARSGYKNIQFAYPIKLMLTSVFLYTEIEEQTVWDMLYGKLKEMPVPELNGHTTRYALQTLGTEWGRTCIDKNLWINIALEKAKRYSKTVITDVRFPNEAEAIRSQGGIVIKLERDVCRTLADDHASEAVDNCDIDYLINNNHPIEYLGLELKRIVTEYEARRN